MLKNPDEVEDELEDFVVLSTSSNSSVPPLPGFFVPDVPTVESGCSGGRSYNGILVNGLKPTGARRCSFERLKSMDYDNMNSFTEKKKNLYYIIATIKPPCLSFAKLDVSSFSSRDSLNQN